MPELPEVEVVRRGLEPRVAGRAVEHVTVRETRLRWPITADLAVVLPGLTLRALDRRGKYLLFDFGAGTLIVHLGMSGQLRWLVEPGPAQRHDHVDIAMSGGGVLRYTDPRRFGALLWHPAACGRTDHHPRLAGLGIEPLSDAFNGERLYRLTRKRSVTIKQWLLSGRAVVGVGNIYASESLFRAAIRPTTRAGRLTRARCNALADAIRETLSDAIARGGSTLRDFVDSAGEQGYFQLDCLVYGRAGAPCRRCGTPIALIRQQQRASYFCPVCQAH
ncbi:MAG: DNA-formamidopyrimidine glycosylase [Pseudomonadota bacterium]|jgi:formamidopyrimidine-DNA glycosylase